MTLKNTTESYGAVAKGLHWAMATIIIGVLGLGLYMSDLPPDPFKFQLYGLHKAFGVTVLGLVVLRLLWRLGNGVPTALPHHAQWEKFLARAAHYALYALMMIVPLSGWAMSSAGGHPVSFFGLFTLPALIGENPDLGRDIAEMHETLAWSLMGVVALHVAGALKHHFVDKDETLLRMLPSCSKCCGASKEKGAEQ